jgi:hypothetical protein
MRMNLHARIEIAIGLALLLGSCGSSEFKSQFSDAERGEIGDIAGDVAGDVIGEDDKIRQLEGRIDAIEQRLNL